MPHRLSVSRAARLAGVSRATIQKKISHGEMPTFEGEVRVKDLLSVFPDIDLDSNTELDRVSKIKEKAYGKRIRERVLPSPEVLLSRLKEATRAHALVKMQLGRIKKIIESLDVLYLKLPSKNNGGRKEVAADDLESIKKFLLEELHATDPDEELAPIMAKNEMLNIVSGQVKMVPSGKEFFVPGNDSILEAALSAGINLNWGCSNGNCGLCKAKLISGKTRKISHHDFSFKETDKSNNTILMCCHTPITNIEIEAEELGLSNIPAQKIKCKVKKITRIEDGILELLLQTPRSKRMRFFAGQSVNLSINSSKGDKGLHRILPIASCPCDDRNIQFHVRENDNDEFASYLLHKLKAGDPATIQGPEGDFIYDDDASGSTLFIAANTGFAPIQGLIEHAMAVDTATSIMLLRIQESPGKPYLDNRCRSWADALDEINYDVIHESDKVEDIIEEITGQLQPTQIFIAGPKRNLDALKKIQALTSPRTKFLTVSASGFLESG
jgi:CDP-4-dehydro-6-deoxyglucose reductase